MGDVFGGLPSRYGEGRSHQPEHRRLEADFIALISALFLNPFIFYDVCPAFVRIGSSKK